MARLLAAGWTLLGVDVIYWFWLLGRGEETGFSGLHVWLNTISYVGGVVLFLLLVGLTLAYRGARRAGRI